MGFWTFYNIVYFCGHVLANFADPTIKLFGWISCKKKQKKVHLTRIYNYIKKLTFINQHVTFKNFLSRVKLCLINIIIYLPHMLSTFWWSSCGFASVALCAFDLRPVTECVHSTSLHQSIGIIAYTNSLAVCFVLSSFFWPFVTNTWGQTIA